MYVSVYQIVEIHFLDVSWRFPFTNPFSKNTIVAMLLTSAMNMFAFKFILAIKCSIIINAKKKKTLSLWWLLHLASPHNSKCRIYNLPFFLFHIYKVGFETNSNKIDNENQSKNQKKKKKKNKKTENKKKFRNSIGRFIFSTCVYPQAVKDFSGF